jgi:subtilase family serine protease
MREYKRRVWLGVIMVFSLLAGVCTPASILADNAKTLASPTSSPDLITETISWSPEIPLIDDTVTFTVTIKNQGGSQASLSQIAYYIDDTYQTSEPINQINAGATATATFTWEAQAGSHTIKAVADANNEVTESDESNNANTFAFSVLAPDLIIDTITWSPENPSIDEAVTFTVAIKNQGNSGARCSHVDLQIDGFSRSYQEVTRIDAGATVTKTFSWKAQAGSPNIKAIADVLNQVSESDETNNDKKANYATAAPDLIISKISWSPTNFSEDTLATLSVTIKNQGNGKAHPSYMAYYIDDTYLDSAYVSQIEAGATATKSFTWIAQAGFHDVKAVADARQMISESDETNNDKRVDLPALVPDLIIQNITCSPTSPSIADEVTSTVTIKNQGKSQAAHSHLYLYIDDAYKYQQILSLVGASETVTRTFTWTAKSNKHTLKAVADGEDEIEESNESNNVKTTTLTCSSTASSDIAVRDITWSPENPAVGDKVTFTVSIKNQGSDQIDSLDVDCYIDDNQQTSVSIDESINAGDITTTTFTWTAQAGFHNFEAVADPNNIIVESDETNNEETVALITLAPDLVIQGITWSPVSPSTGDLVTFTVTIKNQGNEKASPSYVGYYIDGASRGYHDVPEIYTDATVTKTFTWTAQAGTHTIQAVADLEGQVIEGNELNNERILNLPAPDLIIDKITWSPENPSIDDIITFSIVLKNQGNGSASFSRVHIYIDDSSRSYNNIQKIDAAATATTTFAWKAQAGAHIITTVVDEENDITESDESNNEEAVAFSVFSPPETAPESEPTPVSKNSANQEASVHLSCQSKQVAPGEDIVLNLNAVNPTTNPTMTVKLILEVPPEMSVTSPELIKGDDGQYNASYSVAPGDIRQMELIMIANQEGNFDITGLLTYSLDGEDSPVDSQILFLPVTVGTNEEIVEESPTTFLSVMGNWMIWWSILAVVVLGGIAMVYMLKFRKRPH